MFWPKFLELCNIKGESPNAVANKLKLSSSAVTKWKAGARPQDRTLYKIADYFNVPVFMFDDPPFSPKQPVTSDEEETESELDGLRFALYGDPAKDVTKEDLQDVIDFAKYVRQRRKDKN